VKIQGGRDSLASSADTYDYKYRVIVLTQFLLHVFVILLLFLSKSNHNATDYCQEIKLLECLAYQIRQILKFEENLH